MNPINYSVDVQTPFQAAMDGYKAGAGIRNDQLQAQQNQLAIEQKQKQQQVLQSLIANPNPTAKDYADATLLLPGLREQLEQGWKMRSNERQQGDLDHASQVYAALGSGKPDIAAKIIQDRADSLRSSGDEKGAQTAEAIVGTINADPALAMRMIGMKLAAAPGGDKVIEGVTKLGGEARAAEKAPAELRAANAGASEAEAKATTAGVTAKYAEPTVLKDLELKGWNVENIKSEIGYRKESNRIALLNAQAAQQTNALKKQELQLQIDKARQTLDQTVRDKTADLQSATSTIDNLLSTVDRVKQNKSLNNVLGSVEGRLGSYLSDEGSDAIALIDTLGSQAFLSQLPAMKGTGALSEREGDKLQASLQNLNRTQSEGQFRENLDEVQRLMLKARKNLETRYGIKAGVPDTPFVKTPEQDIDSLVSKYLKPQPLGAR